MGQFKGKGTWEEMQAMSFKGHKCKSYVPLTHFFLKLYGENFDYYLALQSCTNQQQELWQKIINPKVQGMMSPPMLGKFCKTFAGALESIKLSNSH